LIGRGKLNRLELSFRPVQRYFQCNVKRVFLKKRIFYLFLTKFRALAWLQAEVWLSLKLSGIKQQKEDV
jgi:hypothetical protein